MEKAVTSGHELDKRAEVENRTDCAFVDLSLLGLSHDSFDFGQSRIDACLVAGSDFNATDSEFLVLVD